jgi:hypothetical protein
MTFVSRNSANWRQLFHVLREQMLASLERGQQSEFARLHCGGDCSVIECVRHFEIAYEPIDVAFDGCS